MRFKILILGIFVHATLCKSQNSTLFEISPAIFKDNKISLADIVDDILYIPLDNNIPIGISYKLKITKDNIYLSTKDVGILKFDRSGKLICVIGTHGRGPGEVWYGMDYTIDERTGNVFVMDKNEIKVYSKSGTFKRSINYSKFITGLGGDIEIFNSSLFIPDYIQEGNSNYNWIIFDTLGNLISKKVNSVPPFSINVMLPGQIYKFEDKLFYFNLVNDTIFSISPDLKSKGAYLFSKGNYRFPNTDFTFKSPMELYDFFKPADMFESKQFIFLTYSYLDRYALSIIDKKSKRIYLAYKYVEKTGLKVKTMPFIMNNLDAGMPWSSRSISNYYIENDSEYITTLISPFDLKSLVLTDEFKKTVPKYPDKKKKLENMASNLRETDNPILMIVKLKK
jgi:hypothetical protein